jgi:hypothetical protein
MSPGELAYAEALRRIQETEDTRATSLDLRGLYHLVQLPREVERLSSLQTLCLSGCRQLSGDLTPLAGLSSLQGDAGLAQSSRRHPGLRQRRAPPARV